MKGRVIAIALVAGIVAVLNIAPSHDSHTFEQRSFSGGFGPSRGWPFSAVAPASEEGNDLVRGSVVQGGTTVYRDRFNDSQYPHLAVNWSFVVMDLVIAASLIIMSLFLPRLLRRRPVEGHDPRR